MLLQSDHPATLAQVLTAIYGNWRRGTGILNNQLYAGRLVWNRQRFVKDPAEVVKVQQKVSVTVLEVDQERSRISLSMKSSPGESMGGKRPTDGGNNKGKRPQGHPKPRSQRGPRSGKPQKRSEPAPFNNPFADLLKNR